MKIQMELDAKAAQAVLLAIAGNNASYNEGWAWWAHDVAINEGFEHGNVRVTKIQEHLIVDDSHAYGGDGAKQRVLGEFVFGEQSFYRQVERDEGAVDRGGACAAIGLQNVAINPDGA